MPDSNNVSEQLRHKLDLLAGRTKKPKPPPCLPCQKAKGRAKMLAATKAASTLKTELGIRLSVIAASAQEGHWVKDTIDNVRSDYPNAEIIICDDNSTDGSCDNLGTDITVLRSTVRHGAGLSQNIALSAATGNVFVCIDPHEEYSDGLFRGMAEFVLENQCIACPTVANMADKAAQGCGAYMKYIPADNYPVIKYNNVIPGAGPRRIDAVVGAAYFFTREIYNRLPSWPSIIDIWGYEEETLAIWAYMQDIPIYGVPNHTVYHYYRDGKPVPWGGPSAEGLRLNVQAALFMLFERETYDKVFARNEVHIQVPALKAKLTALKTGKAYDTGQWKIGKVKSDQQVLADFLQIPGASRLCIPPLKTTLLKTPATPVSSDTLKASIIIPTYNRDDLLVLGLRSIRTQPDIEVIVVDDGGDMPRDTLDCCQKFGARYIRLEESGRRVPSVPINTGVRMATGDIVVLTCPEIYHLQPNTIELLLEPLLVSDTIYSTCKGWDDYGDGLAAVRAGDDISKAILDTMGILQTDFPFFMAIHKKHFTAIGGYDEGFLGWGCEDHDFVTRLQGYGLQKHVSEARIVHLSHERYHDEERYHQNLDRFNKLSGTIIRNQ